MDRLIATGTVVQAQADLAPATGTPGFATDGNPAANVPATQWPAYQYNSIQEELMAIIAAGNVTPDRTQNNQVLAAIMALIKGTALPVMTFAQVAALTADQGPIQVTDMGPSSLYVWSTSAYFTGYRSVHCGEIPRNMAAAPRAWEESVIGGTWSTSDPKQNRLIAWFQEQGLTVASASWTAGMGMIASLGSGNWKAPDLRNVFLRMSGTDADTANAAPTGTYKADELKTHQHTMTYLNASPLQSGSNTGYGTLELYSAVPPVGFANMDQAAGPNPGGAETAPKHTRVAPVVLI